MGKKLMSITALQMVGDKTDEVTVLTKGLYKNTPAGAYIRYSEYSDINPLMKSTSHIKIGLDGVVTLTRHGLRATRFALEKGNRHLCQYATDFGNIYLGIYTSDVINNLHETGGSLRLVYSMDVNSELMSTNDVTINIQED